MTISRLARFAIFLIKVVDSYQKFLSEYDIRRNTLIVDNPLTPEAGKVNYSHLVEKYDLIEWLRKYGHHKGRNNRTRTVALLNPHFPWNNSWVKKFTSFSDPVPFTTNLFRDG